jgi:hypothetical protein
MEKNLGVHLDILCLHTILCEKRTIFMGCAKKIKQHLVKGYFAGLKIVLYTSHKKYYFFAKCCVRTYNVRMYT